MNKLPLPALRNGWLGVVIAWLGALSEMVGIGRTVGRSMFRAALVSVMSRSLASSIFGIWNECYGNRHHKLFHTYFQLRLNKHVLGSAHRNDVVEMVMLGHLGTMRNRRIDSHIVIARAGRSTWRRRHWIGHVLFDGTNWREELVYRGLVLDRRVLFRRRRWVIRRGNRIGTRWVGPPHDRTSHRLGNRHHAEVTHSLLGAEFAVMLLEIVLHAGQFVADFIALGRFLVVQTFVAVHLLKEIMFTWSCFLVIRAFELSTDLSETSRRSKNSSDQSQSHLFALFRGLHLAAPSSNRVSSVCTSPRLPCSSAVSSASYRHRRPPCCPEIHPIFFSTHQFRCQSWLHKR